MQSCRSLAAEPILHRTATPWPVFPSCSTCVWLRTTPHLVFKSRCSQAGRQFASRALFTGYDFPSLAPHRWFLFFFLPQTVTMHAVGYCVRFSLFFNHGVRATQSNRSPPWSEALFLLVLRVFLPSSVPFCGHASYVFLRFGESFLVPSFSSANLQHCPWSFGPQAKPSGQDQPRARQAPLLSISNKSSFTFRALGSGYRLTTCSDSSSNQHPSSTFPLATTSSFIFSLASINSIIHSRDLAILDHFVMANARLEFFKGSSAQFLHSLHMCQPSLHNSCRRVLCQQHDADRCFTCAEQKVLQLADSHLNLLSLFFKLLFLIVLMSVRSRAFRRDIVRTLCEMISNFSLPESQQRVSARGGLELEGPA